MKSTKTTKTTAAIKPTPALRGGVRVPGSGHTRFELSQAKKDARPMKKGKGC